MSDKFEKDLRDHLHREAAEAKDLPAALPGRIRKGLDSGSRFTPIQQLAVVAAMMIFIAAVGFLVVQLKASRGSLPAQPNAGLSGFACSYRSGGSPSLSSLPTDYRVSTHGGFDRVVFSFGRDASGIPTYWVRQAPISGQESQTGSYAVVVSFNPVRPAPSIGPSGELTSGLIPIGGSIPTDTRVVKTVQLLGTGPGWLNFTIALANSACFRVTELTSPAALAVDFAASPTFACSTQEGGSETGGPYELRGLSVEPVQNPSSQSFDRMTLSFDSGVPPFGVIPQDSSTFSRYDGSNVTLQGDSGIRIKLGNVNNTDISKIGWSMSSGEPPTKTSVTDFTPFLTAIREVAVLDNSQGTIQFGIGLATPACFRVTEQGKTLKIDFQTAPPVAKVPFQVPQLSFVDALHGWALGTASKGQTSYLVLARTIDGGATWHYLPFKEPSIANAVGANWHIFFEDAQVGWLYGPYLYGTRDGGTNWATSPSGPVTVGLPPLLALSAYSDSVWAIARPQQCTTATGVGSCPPYLSVSSDGGRSWTRAAKQPAIIGAQAQIVRVSNLYGWILSWQPDRTSLAVTHDGGVTWQTLTAPCAPAASFEDRIAAIDDMNVWIVCGSQPGAGSQQKQLVTSTDGGFHWSHSPNPPSTGYVSRLALSGPTSGLTGWLATARGPLYLTTDGGRTWQNADSRGVAVDLAGSGALEVVFSDPLHGWAATATEIFRTTDGGLHWTGAPAQALE